MWNDTDINLGRIKVGSNNMVRFIFNKKPEDKFRVLNVEVTCDCLSPSYNNTNININYKPRALPIHLTKDLGMKSQHVLKYVNVTWEINGEKKNDIFNIRAEVFE